MEDIYQIQNASSIVRSCESLGISDLFVVEKRNKFITEPKISLDAEKQLNIFKYNEINSCLDYLKKEGYLLIATIPHQNAENLDKFVTKAKIALMFGTEEKGLSQEALERADSYLKIPMYGFTESLNISVSLAITLFHLRHNP